MVMRTYCARELALSLLGSDGKDLVWLQEGRASPRQHSRKMSWDLRSGGTEGEKGPVHSQHGGPELEGGQPGSPGAS